MPHFKKIALQYASRLVNHGPTALVTSAHGAARNVMAAAWSMPVEFEPPRIAIVIDKKTYTRELIMASGGFGICLPGSTLAALTHAVGSESGRAVDKFAKYGLQTRIGPLLGLPMLEQGCAAWLECRLIREPHTEDAYDTCFAEVVAAAADERVFRQGHWFFGDDNTDLHTIHHLGGGNFVKSSGMFHVGHAAVAKPHPPSKPV